MEVKSMLEAPPLPTVTDAILLYVIGIVKPP
jgi:hypothetical protein